MFDTPAVTTVDKKTATSPKRTFNSVRALVLEYGHQRCRLSVIIFYSEVHVPLGALNTDMNTSKFGWLFVADMYAYFALPRRA